MSLAEYRPSERERQISQWRAARARIEAAAIVKAKENKAVQKSVEKLTIVSVSTPIQPVPVHERDWLDVQTKYAIADIVKEVCEQFGVSRNEILSRRRSAEITSPRQVAMTLAKHLTARSFPEIGRKIGDRDHTTVIHACAKYEPLMLEVIKKVPDCSPIRVWVSAFKQEITLTEHARRKPYRRQYIEPKY